MGIIDLGTAFQTKDVVRSICHWNALRYDQEHNHKLSVKLLAEEHLEYLEAWIDRDLVKTVDGLADVFFVAVGAMWKHGWAPKYIIEQMDAMQNDPLYTADVQGVGLGIDIYAHTNQPEMLAYTALKALETLEEVTSEGAAMDIIRAVCDSNDTKAVKKTASDVKANINKGEDYIPPEAAIRTILDDLGGPRL